MSNSCPVHGTAWKTIPAGVSKSTGKPYNSFQACSERGCREKPPKAPEGRQGAEQRFNENLAVGDAQVRQDKKDHSIVRTALVKSAFERGSLWSEDLKKELEEAEAWIQK